MSRREDTPHKNMGGETPSRREAIQRMTRQLREAGQSSAKAQEIARKQALRADREGR